MQKHVLVACHAWYGDECGGSFRLASEFAQHLAEQGYRVSYVCCSPGTTEALPEAGTSDGVHLFRYPASRRKRTGPGRMHYHLHMTRQLVRRINAQNPIDVLSGHSPLQALGAARSLNGSKAFVNYTVHSPFDEELLSNSIVHPPKLKIRLAALAARQIDRQNVRHANRLQTLSQFTLDNFTDKFGSLAETKGIVAPGWVEADRFVPHKDIQALRKKLGGPWQTDSPILFTLRRLESRMGLDTFIEACAILSQQGLNFRTLIGGGGSMRNHLQGLINSLGLQEHIHLLGRLPEESLPIAYAACDCFVLPTRALECFGLIVLEAFACNTPVIASRAGAIPELASRQGEQWMFEPANVEQLADRLRNFLTGKRTPEIDLRSAALEFDKPKILRQWTELLNIL